MKTLFNLAAAYMNVCTAVVNTATNAVRAEGHVIIPFLRDLRVSFVESNLPAAIKGYVHATAAQSSNPPSWASEVLAEQKLIQKELKAFSRELAELESRAVPGNEAQDETNTPEVSA